MSEYQKVKPGKLRLKGEKRSKRKHKNQNKDNDLTEQLEIDSDMMTHGGWWSVEKFEEISGAVALEFRPHCYMKALDTGLFVLGGPHRAGDGPDPEEVLTAIRVSDTKIALKSGYGKYIRVAADGRVIGRSDAIGSMEQWEPVFQDGKLAILSCTNNFLLVDDNEDIVATSRTAKENEILQVRSIAEKVKSNKAEVPIEEQGSLKACEINYIKQFQGGKTKINPDSLIAVKRAKRKGNLHEELLCRRVKMKSDKFCK